MMVGNESGFDKQVELHTDAAIFADRYCPQRPRHEGNKMDYTYTAVSVTPRQPQCVSARDAAAPR